MARSRPRAGPVRRPDSRTSRPSTAGAAARKKGVVMARKAPKFIPHSDATSDAIHTLARGVHRARRRSPLALAAGLAVAPLNAVLADPFPALLSLSSLLPANGGDGSTGFVIGGFAQYGLTGSAVSAAG